MTYRSDFSGMTENIDLVVKLLWDGQLPPLNTFGV